MTPQQFKTTFEGVQFIIDCIRERPHHECIGIMDVQRSAGCNCFDAIQILGILVDKKIIEPRNEQGKHKINRIYLRDYTK